MTDTPTPRADVESHWTTFDGGFHLVERCQPQDGKWVPIDFARQLELELAAAKAEIESLKTQLKEWMP